MKQDVIAYLHTHWDREWYRNKEDFNIRFLEVFDIVLDELESGRAPFFYLDGQAIALLDYLKFKIEKKDLIIKLIKDRKLAIGPYFVSADSFLVNFKCMLKNLEIGMKYSRSFGETDFIGYMADIFGISNSAFKALEFSDINKAVIWRGVNPKLISDDANFIKNNVSTVWLVQGYFNDFLHEGNIDGLEKYLDKISKYSSAPLLLPIGADHLGMLKDAKNVILDVNKKLKNYNIILSSPFEYFKKAKFLNKTAPFEFLDNSCTYILSGVYSARINQKILNNSCQTLLTRLVEPLNYFLKAGFESNIDFAYETLIKNHAHDGIYGCSTDDVHKSVESRFRKVEQISNSLVNNIIHKFKKNNCILGNTSDKFGVFNLSNSDMNVFKIKTPYKIKNSQVIRKEKAFPQEILDDIYKIPVTEQIVTIYTSLVQTESVESFSFSTCKILKPKKETIVTNSSIENKFIKLYIKNNTIYILNKNTKQKIKFSLQDILDSGDSYNSAPFGKYDKFKILKTKIAEDGNIRSCLKIYFKNIQLYVYLDNSSEFISFSAEILNKKKNHKIQACFTLDDKINSTVSDDAIGIVKRNIETDYCLKDNIPVKYPFEAKTNIYPMQSFVNVNNISVMTKGLNEYEIFKNNLYITLLRCTGTISNPKNPARAIPAGPNLECYDSQYLNKKIKLNFSLLFGDYFRAYRNIDLYNEVYVSVDGDFKYEQHIKYINKGNDSFIYGISNDKKISYNIKSGHMSLI